MLRVLLVSPDFTTAGGVTEFNKLLLQYSKVDIKPFFLSGTGKNRVVFLQLVLIFYDIIRFCVTNLFGRHSIVHLGPSLGRNALWRDAILCWLAKTYGKKVFIQLHGWNPSNEYLLEGCSLALLKRTLFKADHIRFLSTSFQHVIISKGFINSTSLGKTFIDDNLLDINYNYHATNKVVRILFLSTVSRNKGVYLVLEVFERLYKHFENISLTIAGDGPELNEIKSIIRQRNIKGIDTPGYVIGEHKTRLLNESDIYVFPSYYEGMPLSLIEAMASGLPVVCSAVGAIPDFFVDGKMGFIIKEQNIETYYDALELLITNSVLRKDMGEFNYLYAKDNFLASINVRKISEEYLRLFESRDVS